MKEPNNDLIIEEKENARDLLNSGNKQQQQQ
jgi:hypothetical protein